MNKKQHVTYFILAPDANCLKIGQCTEVDPPKKRLAALQTGSPEVLRLLLVLPHRPPFEESTMHYRFSQYRTRGEWFEYRAELKSFVEAKMKNPVPTADDDLRSVNGCIPASYAWDQPELTFVSSREQKSYSLYVEYCSTVGCAPATFEKWLKLTYNPVEYEDIASRVPKIGKTGNLSKTESHIHEPYDRWESAFCLR